MKIVRFTFLFFITAYLWAGDSWVSVGHIAPASIIVRAGESRIVTADGGTMTLSVYNESFEQLTSITIPVTGPFSLQSITSVIYRPPQTLFIVDGIEMKIIEADLFLNLLKAYMAPEGPGLISGAVAVDNYSWIFWDPVNSCGWETFPGSSRLTAWGKPDLLEKLYGNIQMNEYQGDIYFWSDERHSLITAGRWGSYLNEIKPVFPHSDLSAKLSAEYLIIRSLKEGSRLLNLNNPEKVIFHSEKMIISAIQMKSKLFIIDEKGMVYQNR